MGIDSEGECYLSLLQANSNGQIMEIFFRALAKKLDSERPHWRKDTIIILDNAPYHHGKAILKVFEALDIPIMFTGPHSYQAAPCELWFASFKAVDINTGRLPTNKR